VTPLTKNFISPSKKNFDRTITRSVTGRCLLREFSKSSQNQLETWDDEASFGITWLCDLERIPGPEKLHQEAGPDFSKAP